MVGVRGGGLVVWHRPLQAESCLAEALGRGLSRADYEGHLSGQKKAPPPVHGQTSMHQANCPYTQTRTGACCTPACVNKGGETCQRSCTPPTHIYMIIHTHMNRLIGVL